MTLPRLYGELGDWFHLFTHPSDYEEEATIFIVTFDEHAPRPIKTMLELGSGGGNNASYMKRRYEMTLTDLSQTVLEQSKKINPECEHIRGDMRTLRLGRTFDAVFVHDAIAYMTTEEDLEAAMRTAYEHVEPPGIALFVPDETTETFRRHSYQGGHGEGDRSLSYLGLTGEPEGTSFKVHFTITLRERDEERVVSDTHEVGLFPRTTWLSLLERTGFTTRTAPFRHSEFAPGDVREIFIGLKL